ncbi:MAG: DNA translocase FtsK 4TM domain-containing protein [candidate division Zixibacteria bacterium]|nr:DNA translocase FtsK 4TM domain-containing protein [Candidatus Tariuqbacter arcticus]
MQKHKEDTITRLDKVVGLLIITTALLTFIALIGFHHNDWPAGVHQGEIENPLRQLGSLTAWALVNFTFGRWGSFAFPFILLFWGMRFLSRVGKPFRHIIKLVVWGFFIGWAIHLVSRYFEIGYPTYQWGMISGGFAGFLEDFTGFTGAWIITVVVFLLMIEFTIGLRSPKMLIALFAKLTQKFRQRREKSRSEQIRREKWHRRDKIEISKEDKVTTDEDKIDERVDTGEEITRAEKQPAKTPKPDDPIPEEYIFPQIDLLTPPIDGDDISDEELRTSAAALEQRLEEFGVQARVIAIHPGPVITRFDLQPAPGVKVSRIVTLQNDLSLSMRAPSIRILAPIPGQAAVGLEVPNSKIRIVRIRPIIESEKFKQSESKLMLALGVDASGEPFVTNLQEMPHLLVAGTTGSGKSVCLNGILASILFHAKPDEVRIALIDPKKLELSVYEPLLEHHLITPPGVKEPVVTEAESAIKLLKSLEMELRLRLNRLSHGGYRSIEEFNRKRKESRMPFLVLVIDELADLMLTAGGAVENPIARLAQMGRAVGIHLIVATQRPSVDVLTGIIKANFPCRIAFQVASKVDSRTVLDANGAETLLGNGDMLFLPPGVGAPVRLHGSLITTEEIEAIVNHISRQPTMEDMMELPDPMEEEQRPLVIAPEHRDELYEQAAKMIAVHQQGSVSLLQRKFKIGYARAARIIDQLEAAGIVGPFDGSKARRVLVSETWLPEMGAPGDAGAEGNGY